MPAAEQANAPILPAESEIALTDDDRAQISRSRSSTPVLVIFFDDMKGSGELEQQIASATHDGKYQDIRREHDDLLTEIITRNAAGEIKKSTGDGLLAVFFNPADAVDRALEIQEKLFGHPYIKVRIGIDMGQVIVEGAGGVQRDTFGRHVVLAQRIQKLAEPGHILVTRSVYEDASDILHNARASWKAQGLHLAKGDEKPFEVFEPYNANISSPMNFSGRNPPDALPRSAPALSQNPAAELMANGPWFHHVLKNITVDRTMLDELCGFWEVYHYGLSQRRRISVHDNPLLSLSLLEFTGFNNQDQRLMDCNYTDYDRNNRPIEFEGVAFKLRDILHIFIQDKKAGSETSSSLVYIPRTGVPEIAYGVIAGLSGFFAPEADLAQIPSAAKLALRRLGNPQTNWAEAERWQTILNRCVKDIATWASIVDQKQLRQMLRERVRGYIDPLLIDDATLQLNGDPIVRRQFLEIAREIRNDISPDAVPFCLRCPD